MASYIALKLTMTKLQLELQVVQVQVQKFTQLEGLHLHATQEKEAAIMKQLQYWNSMLQKHNMQFEK